MQGDVVPPMTAMDLLVLMFSFMTFLYLLEQVFILLVGDHAQLMWWQMAGSCA